MIDGEPDRTGWNRVRANGGSIHQEKEVSARGAPAPLSAVASCIAVLMVAIFVAGCGPSGMGSGIPVFKSSGRTWETYPRVKQTDILFSQSVHVVVPDGSGGFYIGGEFTNVGGLTRNNIAHILSDGTVDET